MRNLSLRKYQNLLKFRSHQRPRKRRKFRTLHQKNLCKSKNKNRSRRKIKKRSKKTIFQSSMMMRTTIARRCSDLRNNRERGCCCIVLRIRLLCSFNKSSWNRERGCWENLLLLLLSRPDTNKAKATGAATPAKAEETTVEKTGS